MLLKFLHKFCIPTREKILELRVYSTYCREDLEKFSMQYIPKWFAFPRGKDYPSEKYLGMFLELGIFE